MRSPADGAGPGVGGMSGGVGLTVSAGGGSVNLLRPPTPAAPGRSTSPFTSSEGRGDIEPSRGDIEEPVEEILEPITVRHRSTDNSSVGVVVHDSGSVVVHDSSSVTEVRFCRRSSTVSSVGVGATRGSASSFPDSGVETCTRVSDEDLADPSSPFYQVDSERSDRTSRTSHTLRRSATVPVLQNLDEVLNNELRPSREDSEDSGGFMAARRRAELGAVGMSDHCRGRSSELVDTSSEDQGERMNNLVALAQDRMQSVAWIIDNRWWQTLFMSLTIYALFALDVDQHFGDKDSKLTLSIVTTVVFGMFLVELVMQSLVKPNYACRAYFWLDLVALLSLLPDTWFVQALVFGDDSAFAAGRSSKIARIIRVAARSTKATRLNRLTRIVRVATLMPRLLVVFGKQGKDEETQKEVTRKLRKIFAFLDEDLDGYITKEDMFQCVGKLRSQGESQPRLSKQLAASESSLPASNLPSMPSMTFMSLPAVAMPTLRYSKTHFQSTDSGNDSLPVSASTTGFSCRTSGISDPERLVDFDEFCHQVLREERTKNRLLAACRQQVSKANNMHNIASRHSEDVGVKVALGVLLTLLVLGVLEPTVEDYSPQLGLRYLDNHVIKKPECHSDGVWSSLVREHVAVWEQQVVASSAGATKLLYLDIQKKVFCNEFHLHNDRGQSCGSPMDVPLTWSRRGTLQELDDELFSSHYRIGDLLILRVSLDPDADLDDLGDAELDRITTSSAVFLAREGMQEKAVYSMMTTLSVIVIILAGIILLTRDLNYMSLSLMRPLRALADDMQSIVQLQIAALTMEQNTNDKSCAEIRQIQSIFSNMKKAIKSWGKYVPWPVVQILLNAGVDARPGVRFREVTIFFSDIASFTTIVESLQPESSLLLLSRYFNEMSKVIDENSGIVIEFIGDAIFAVFGAPIKNAEHPIACVRAALAMLSSLDKINAWSASRSLPQISIRCGVHTGRVLIGNMGYHSRMKYGVVGHNANVPDRLEELNKTYGTNLLISQATMQRLPDDAFVIRPIDYVTQNTNTPGPKIQPVYEVMARDRRGMGKHKLRAPAAHHRRALKKYREGHFEQALGMFTEVGTMLRELRAVEEDPPSALMIKRCRACIERPPERWTGVWEQS